MKTDDIIDTAFTDVSNRIKKRHVYAFTIFALLDSVSFIRSFDFLSEIIQIGFQIDVFVLCRSILILSLLASAILFALRKKQGLIIYFIQLPFKVVFFSLSFAFLLDLAPFTYGSPPFLAVVVTLFILEVLRLIYSAILYRRL